MLVNVDISNACGTSCMHIPYNEHCCLSMVVNMVGGCIGNM
jgi:hypothetical protein